MVSEKKVKRVEEIKKFLTTYPTIVIVDMYKTPTNALQKIKKKLEDFSFKFVKKSLLLVALEQLKDEKLLKIKNILPNQILLIGANADPFKIFLEIRKTKVRRFAKPGDVAQEDIVIPAGPTSLPAGPAISEFAKAKIPAGVEGGKIAVKKTTVVAKMGEKIPEGLISLLRKLSIRPITVVLNVKAIYKDGEIYTRDVLDLVEIYPQKLREIILQALNFCVNIAYPTKESIKYLLIKAHTHAKVLEEKIEGVGG